MPLRPTYGLMLSVSIAALAIASPAFAQDAVPAEAAPAVAQASDDQAADIVVTGVAQGRNRLDASASMQRAGRPAASRKVASCPARWN